MPCGSSPRSRGTHRRLSLLHGPARLIPAFAGNTRPGPFWQSTKAAHPRVRGEHHCAGRLMISQTGSSPRSRGTQPARRRHPPGRRLIPAFAGNTRALWPASSSPAAHPRVRGEHGNPMPDELPGDGSSPRSRGTRARKGRAGHHQRLIPAFAGNTHRQTKRQAREAAHPRVRGEHLEFSSLHVSCYGSSPRSRGTHGAPAHLDPRSRLIPAFAGNTNQSQTQSKSQTAHPRVRGEHCPYIKLIRALVGSSPRSRGTHASTVSNS